jgi:anthranilate synthase/aminodeoxychorismate synthase-like glutamine amidotransferase
VHKPPKANSLHATLNEKVKNHNLEPWPVLQMRRLGATRKPARLSRATLDFIMVFVLDNYDSFTYNLVQYLGELGAEVEVHRNDELTVEQVEALRPERILLSPGPCTPGEAGILVPLIRHMAGKVPILGVCLGHQAIGEAFGGQVVRAQHLMHGKTSPVEHDGKGVFAGLPTPLTCTRYHSLIVAEDSLPAELMVTARTPASNGGGSVIMGLRHRSLPIEGVQFHPESVLTEGGHQMIRNFLGM